MGNGNKETVNGKKEHMADKSIRESDQKEMREVRGQIMAYYTDKWIIEI